MSELPSIATACMTLPDIAARETVATRTWVLAMPERPFTEEGFEAIRVALFTHGCKWPHGHPGDADYHACGEAKAGPDYCLRHEMQSKYRGRQ